MLDLWADYGTTSQRGLGTLYDPQPLQTPNADDILYRCIELERIDGRVHEYQQVILVRPTTEYADPLPPFNGEIGVREDSGA